jgi:hypothetical protein
MARQFLAGLRAEAPGALSLRTQRAPIAEFTRQDAPVAKSFPSDFYVTCATAIPVLFLVFAVRGNTYGEMLTVARKAAVTLPRRKRDYYIATGLSWAANFWRAGHARTPAGPGELQRDPGGQHAGTRRQVAMQPER